MINSVDSLHPHGAVACETPANAPAAAIGAAAPGRPRRAGQGVSSRGTCWPGIFGARWRMPFYSRPNSTARAQCHGSASRAGEMRALQEAGRVRGATAIQGARAVHEAKAARGAKEGRDATAAAFRAWKAEGPLAFDALYGNNGSLRRDVVTALWQRIERLLPAPIDARDPANAAVAQDDGTMTDPELHALTEKLKRAEALLGKEDSLALRAVRTLRAQVLGARASLGRPLMVASGGRHVARYAHAGAASTFQLGADLSLPGLPSSITVSPRIGATYASGIEVGDDLWISESRTFEARLGVIGRIKAFFLKLDLSLTGRHARTRSRSYCDQDHLLQAPDSGAYRTERHVAALTDLANAAGRSWHGMPKAFSLHGLDKLRQAAYANHDEFAKTAAMLGIVLAQPQAGAAHHPLAQSHRTSAGAGSPSSTVTTGARLKGGATLSATGEESVFQVLGIHGQIEAGGSKSSTAIRTYVPVWDALDAREAERAGAAATQRRLDHLRAALPPMSRALRTYHGTPAPAASASSRRADVPRTLDALSAWTPGAAPLPSTDLNDTLEALAAELDLYCQARRRGADDERAQGLARSIEQAWGIKRKHGAYGYLRALAIAAALAGQHARATQRPLPPAYEGLTARLAAPAMRYDSVLMQRATGFRNTLPIEAWQIDMALGADAGLSLPPLSVSADVSGRIRGSRVTHFNALKGGDFIDVEVTVGVAGQLSIVKIIDPVTGWIGGRLSHAMSALAEAGLPADMAATLSASLGGALKTVSPSLEAGAHLVFVVRYSRPLAATAPDAGDAASSEAGRAPCGFNLEYVRMLARIDGAQNTEILPLATVMGRDAIRSVLMRLDNCYRKDDDRVRAEREARAYLSSLSARRDLPGLFENLGQDGSAAARQMRAFVREAAAHVADAEGARVLRSREADFFNAMKAYAAASATAAAPPARTAPSGAALPEYAAAERALLALTAALRAPAGVYQGKRTAYATALGKLRASA